MLFFGAHLKSKDENSGTHEMVWDFPSNFLERPKKMWESPRLNSKPGNNTIINNNFFIFFLLFFD